MKMMASKSSASFNLKHLKSSTSRMLLFSSARLTVAQSDEYWLNSPFSKRYRTKTLARLSTSLQRVNCARASSIIGTKDLEKMVLDSTLSCCPMSYQDKSMQTWQL